MDNGLVSVALATYNGEKFLEEQLESILNQDYYPLEIVVSDDCSSDGTTNILQRYALEGKIQYWKNEKNLGYVKNFEQAISKCSGQYIALADQDDIWYPSKISRLLESLGDNLLIHSDAVLIDDQGARLKSSLSEFSRKMTIPHSFAEAVLNGSVTGCTSLFRKELIKDILPFPDGLYVHDKWIGVIAFLKNRFTYIGEPLISYRQHNNNTIGLAQSSVSLSKKIKKLFSKRKIQPQFQAFRNSIEKERLFVSHVINRRLINEPSLIEAKEIENFYSEILAGENLFSVVNFCWRNRDAIEKNKTISQKIYYFYLIMNAFFYSKNLIFDDQLTTKSS